MSFKVVIKEQDGQKVVVGFVPAEAIQVIDAEFAGITQSTRACPEPSQEVLNMIDRHPKRSFNLHKVVGSQVVVRSVAELEASTFMIWDFNFVVPPDEVPAPIEEEQD